MPDLADLAPEDVDGRCIATLRMLAVDMVEAANSGHPGLPLGAAPMAWTIWSRFLRYDPARPDWPDRDRFVLSAGHGSALLYALLHVCGYDLTLEDLRGFRQFGSRTPGHPEHGHTPGVEVTTGPLGTGLAHAVGMALAERMAAARFNTDGETPIVDHRTFVLCSDGDLMEGISSEASSLAGHLALDRLAVVWDDNRISIDGSTDLSFSENVCARYRAYGWAVCEVEDGNNLEAIATAIDEVLAAPGQPGFVRVRTTIGYGAPTKAGSPSVHGAPLGASETAKLRGRFGWPDSAFTVPEDVRARAAELASAGARTSAAWDEAFAAWSHRHPDLAAEWSRRLDATVDMTVLDDLAPFKLGKPLATRSASGTVLSALSGQMPELVGGSADLAESTCTELAGGSVRPGQYEGHHIHFGVRELGMAAVLTGLSLHGGFRAVGSTFLVFADFARPALRLAALMQQPVIHVYTHDSIGLGEDGPTHQPIEHLASLRAIPGVAVLRPADANEVIEAWRTALTRTNAPTVLALSRQGLPVLAPASVGWMARQGARIVVEGADPSVVLVATGSEVALATEAAAELAASGVCARVVSMPWRERFLALDAEGRAELLPPGIPVVVVEAGVHQGWDGLTAGGGAMVALDRFGASGKGSDVLAGLGFTAANVANVARDVASHYLDRVGASA